MDGPTHTPFAYSLPEVSAVVAVCSTRGDGAGHGPPTYLSYERVLVELGHRSVDEHPTLCLLARERGQDHFCALPAERAMHRAGEAKCERDPTVPAAADSVARGVGVVQKVRWSRSLLLRATPASIASVNVQSAEMAGLQDELSFLPSAVVTIGFCEGGVGAGSGVCLFTDSPPHATGGIASPLFVSNVTIGPLVPTAAMQLAAAVRRFSARRYTPFNGSAAGDMDASALASPAAAVRCEAANAAPTQPPEPTPSYSPTKHLQGDVGNVSTVSNHDADEGDCAESNPYLALLEGALRDPSLASCRHDNGSGTGDSNDSAGAAGQQSTTHHTASGASSTSCFCGYGSLKEVEPRPRGLLRPASPWTVEKERGGSSLSRPSSHTEGSVLSRSLLATEEPGRGRWPPLRSSSGSTPYATVARRGEGLYAAREANSQTGDYDGANASGDGDSDEEEGECVLPTWFPEAPDARDDEHFRVMGSFGGTTTGTATPMAPGAHESHHPLTATALAPWGRPGGPLECITAGGTACRHGGGPLSSSSSSSSFSSLRPHSVHLDCDRVSGGRGDTAAPGVPPCDVAVGPSDCGGVLEPLVTAADLRQRPRSKPFVSATPRGAAPPAESPSSSAHTPSSRRRRRPITVPLAAFQGSSALATRLPLSSTGAPSGTTFANRDQGEGSG